MRILGVTVPHVSVALGALFITTLVSPYLNAGGHGIRNAWVVFCFWLLSSFLGRPRAIGRLISETMRRKYEFGALILWLMVVVMNALLERGYTSDLHLLTMLTMAMVIFVQLTHASRRDKSDDALLVTVISLIGLEVLRSLPTLWSQPALARIVMGFAATPAMIAEAAESSVGQYGYYTGLAIILPVIVARALVAKGARSMVLWAAAAGIAFAIMIATFMGAILLMALGMAAVGIVHISYSKSIARTATKYGVIILVLAAMGGAWLSNSEQVTYVLDKLTNQVSGISQYGVMQGDVTERTNLWEMSFNTIQDHPIFGVGPVTNRENPDLWTLVGGHSSWLDQPAEYGVVGFLPYILFGALVTARIVKSFKRETNSREAKIFYLAQLISCALFVIGGSYNPVVVVTEVFVLFYLVVGSEPSFAAPSGGRART